MVIPNIPKPGDRFFPVVSESDRFFLCCTAIALWAFLTTGAKHTILNQNSDRFFARSMGERSLSRYFYSGDFWAIVAPGGKAYWS